MHAGINGGIVHVHDILAFSAIGFFVGILQVFHRIFVRNDVGEMEESGLHDHIDTAAKTDVLCDFKGIDDVELCMEAGQLSLHGCRKNFFQVFFLPWRVQEENTARFEAAEQVIFINIGRTMAGDIVSLADEVRLTDRIFAETEMGNGDAAGFLGVIGEVALGIHIGMITDDLDGTLVGTYGTIRAEAPEFAGNQFAGHFRNRNGSKGEIGHIIHDGKGEVVTRVFCLQVFIDSHDIFRNDVLGAQTITAAAHFDISAGRSNCGNHIHVERFADGTGFTGTVEDGNLLYCVRQLGEEMFHGERTIEMNIQDAHFFSMGIEGIGDVFADIGDRTDSDHYAVCIGGAIVIEKMIRPAGDGGNLVHVFLNDIRKGIVEGVGRFTMLEINIRVFSGAADDRMIRIKGAGPEFGEGFLVDEGSKLVIVQDFHFLNFMARTETVEEIDKRYAAFDGSKVCYTGKIHNFLDIGFCQHSAACSSGTHNVLMVAKNGKSMVGKRTGSDMENARKQFAGYFIHIWNHEEHALRCGISCGQGASLEGTVECAGSTAFGLHFYDPYSVSENVLLPMGRPFVHRFCHWGGWGDRVNGSDFSEGVGNIRSRCITIHCFYFCHRTTLLFQILPIFFEKYFCPLQEMEKRYDFRESSGGPRK